jgi:hypothetical protein
MQNNQNSRKSTKTVTRAEYDLVIRMCIDRRQTINHGAAIIQLDRHVVGKIVQEFERGIEFIPSNEIIKMTCAARNLILSNKKIALFNAISLNNSLTLKEVKETAEIPTEEQVSI